MEQVDAFSFSRLDRHFKYDLRVTSNIETAFGTSSRTCGIIE